MKRIRPLEIEDMSRHLLYPSYAVGEDAVTPPLGKEEENLSKGTKDGATSQLVYMK